jgi:hypothetical protein
VTTTPRHAQAAALVRAQIADGTLRPGQAAPSGAHLARLHDAYRAAVAGLPGVPGQPPPPAPPPVRAPLPGAAAPLPPGEGGRIGWFRRSGRRVDDESVRDDDSTRRRAPDENDEVSFGPRRPDGRRPSGRLLIACGAMLATVAAVAATLVTGHGSNPPRARPGGPGAVSTSEAGPRLLGVRASWELFGYGDGRVVRIQFASGRITQTAVPVQNIGTASLVVGPHEAIISHLDMVPGYLVPDGRPARPLSGPLGNGGIAIPGPQPGTAWVQATFQATSMPLVRMDGTGTGVSVRLPPGRGYSQATPDGRGGVLVNDYAQTAATWVDVRPGGFRPVAGILAAAGPTRWLVLDCGAGNRCSGAIVDPATGARHVLPGTAGVPQSAAPGVIAPDGSAAAFAAASGDRVTLQLISLVSGSDQQIPVSLDPESAADQTLAWSPDSRWLFVVTAQGKLAAVDARTGHVESLGVSLPPLRLIAVRN